MQKSRHVLPVIVVSQFCCTSLWFAGNAVMNDLLSTFQLSFGALGHLTSAVQFGFIIGTLLFAILTIADRFSPSNVFFLSALLGAMFNVLILWEGNSLMSLLFIRFLTGFFLAGIYPVGMKIATDYFNQGLGKSLGYLVGALVIGTAFPHLLNSWTEIFEWKLVVIGTSILAIIGGLMMYIFVPDGPYRKSSLSVDLSAFFSVFKNRNFRFAAFGYFGHMWELYAFWAFVPLILKDYCYSQSIVAFNISLWSFLIIGIGGLSCVLSGYLSEHLGPKRVAFTALLLSCLCCLISPMIFQVSSSHIFVGFLLFWGVVVIADSPLFSTLVAQNASSEVKGTALTIVNCIGFSVTIISIQLLNIVSEITDSKSIYMILAVGPVFGLLSLLQKTN